MPKSRLVEKEKEIQPPLFPSLIVIEAVLAPPPEIDAQRGGHDSENGYPFEDYPCNVPGIKWCTSDRSQMCVCGRKRGGEAEKWRWK